MYFRLAYESANRGTDTMPDPDESAYRRHYRATGDDIRVREGDEVESDDGVFEIRMPIASTGEVRNSDDDPLTRAEIDGMARQLSERQVGVFPAHGADDMIAAGRYSPFERLGDWTDAEVESRDDDDVLMATARMPDPETLPAATNEYRTGLAILKEQAKRGVAQDASIGWREDDSFPGGVDLMEASIVGIGADWRTNTGDDAAEVVARAAVDAGADPEALVDAVTRAVEQDADAPDGTQDNDSMTDEPTDDDEPADEQDADTTEERSEEEYREQMLQMQETQTELLRELLDREDDEDGDDEEDEDDDEDDEEQSAEPDDEQDGDEPDETRDVDDEDGDDLREELRTLREELDTIKENGLTAEDVDTPEADDEQSEEPDDETTRDAEDGFEDLGEYRH